MGQFRSFLKAISHLDEEDVKRGSIAHRASNMKQSDYNKFLKGK